jgi:hypothetical protein
VKQTTEGGGVALLERERNKSGGGVGEGRRLRYLVHRRTVDHRNTHTSPS